MDQIKREISKADVNLIPLWHYEGKIVLVQTMEQLAEATERLSKSTEIGFDTESRPSFSKGTSYKTSLLQLAVSDVVYLFRLNELGLPEGISRILENPNIKKIGIATLDDSRGLKRDFGCRITNVLDLNKFCRSEGFVSIGARKLTALILGKRISKNQQTTNWEQEKLSQKQILYAATDAWICFEIYKRRKEWMV
jgi:ribonuclease D